MLRQTGEGALAKKPRGRTGTFGQDGLVWNLCKQGSLRNRLHDEQTHVVCIVLSCAELKRVVEPNAVLPQPRAQTLHAAAFGVPHCLHRGGRYRGSGCETGGRHRSCSARPESDAPLSSAAASGSHMYVPTVQAVLRECQPPAAADHPWAMVYQRSVAS
eukprot:scaffold2799_cov408-Prasinococcus_capsulatus_cf.AAC.1